EATAMIRSKISCPTSSRVAVPSTTRPQLTSMSDAMRWYISEFVASLRQGAGRLPNTDPRPVVKHTTVAPPATMPVTDTGSYPGVSMNTSPRAVTGSAYPYTAVSSARPALATAPSDFSRIVVSPPALLPGDGLLSMLPPPARVYSRHQSSCASSRRPTSSLTERRVSRCSAPNTSGVSASTEVPPAPTSRSDATPRAGFAVMPEYPSEPPQFRPSTR